MLRHLVDSNLDLLGSVKRTYSESTAMPNLPGVKSGSSVKRTYTEYQAAEFSSCLLTQRCVKRAHGESIGTDEEEQPDVPGFQP